MPHGYKNRPSIPAKTLNLPIYEAHAVRPALLFGVCLCVVGLALAAPQLGTTVPPVTEPFADAETASEYGPVQGSYFRAMSYDRYTGTGWERTADAEPLTSLDPPPAGGDVIRVRYAVRTGARTS
jgi:hypothetical protein